MAFKPGDEWAPGALSTKIEGVETNFPAQILFKQNLSWSGLKLWALAQGVDSLDDRESEKHRIFLVL